MPGSKPNPCPWHFYDIRVEKSYHACMIRLLAPPAPAEHEEAAIYIVNQRIPHVRELRGQALTSFLSVVYFSYKGWISFLYT